MDDFSSVLSIIVLALVVISPLVIAVLLLWKFKTLDTPAVQNRIGSLYCELNTKHR